MATPPQLTQVAFAAGIDESLATEILDPNTGFSALRNGRQTQFGGYEKRQGFKAQTTTRLDATTRTTGVKLAMNADQICVLDDTYLDVYSAAADRYIQKQRMPETVLSYFEVPSLGVTAAVVDTVRVGNYLALAFRVTNGVLGTAISCYAALLDATTGAVIAPPALIDSALAVDDIRLVTYGTYAVVIFADETASEIRAKYIDTTSASTINAGWVATALAKLSTTFTGFAMSAASLPSLNDRFAVAYATSSGTNRVTVATFSVTAGAALASTTINTSSVTPASTGGLDISDGTTGYLWVAWNEATAVKTCGLDTTSLAASATTLTTLASLSGSQGNVSVTSTGATTAAIIVSSSSSLGSQGLTVKTTAGAAATDGPLAGWLNTQIAGLPFLRSGRLYAWFHTSNYDDACLVDCTPPAAGVTTTLALRPVAVAIQRGLWVVNPRPRCRSSAISATTYAHVSTVKRTGTTTGAVGYNLDFASPYRWQNTEHYNSLYFSGGLVSVFDGSTVFESGYTSAPSLPTVDVSSVGSQTMTLGGRTYVAVYACADADGNLHISGASLPSVSTGNIVSKKIFVTVRPLAITARDGARGYGLTSNIQILLYGTNDGGSQYHFIASAQNPASFNQIFEDTLTELQVTAGALLYDAGPLPGTSGASQDHRAPPGLNFLVSFNGMLVGANGSDLWASSQPISGVGLWWNPVFSVPCGETVTGIISQDGTLFVFSRGSIFTFNGEPPADNGSSGGLGFPRELASDVGCVESNSLVACDQGVFFLSDRGIELLSRGGGGVSFVGAKVQRTLAAYPVMSAAVLDTRNGLVRFSLAQTRTAGLVSAVGRDLVYDLTLNVWISVDNKAGATADQASQDAMMVKIGNVWRYAWLGTDGAVYYERIDEDADATQFFDGATWITKYARTGWWKTGGLQGKQVVNNVLLLERWAASHNLTVALAYNYNQTTETPVTWDAATLDALLASGWPITAIKHQPHDLSPCSSVSVEIYDALPSGSAGTGESAQWLGLTLDITPEQGLFDVPEAAT